MRLEIFDRRSELLNMLAEAEEMERFRLRFSGVARVRKKAAVDGGAPCAEFDGNPKRCVHSSG